MTTTPSRKNVLVLVAAGVVALSACGNAAETGIEELIESQGGGNVDLDIDGDGGFSIETEEGGMTIDEEGNFVITDADGSVVSGNVDADGEGVIIESEDGTFSSGATTELPASWPADVPEPDGLAISSATVIGSHSDLVVTVIGSVDGEGFVDSYVAALESAGFSEESAMRAEGTINNFYSNGELTVGVLYFGDQSENEVTVTVYSSS